MESKFSHKGVQVDCLNKQILIDLTVEPHQEHTQPGMWKWQIKWQGSFLALWPGYDSEVSAALGMDEWIQNNLEGKWFGL